MTKPHVICHMMGPLDGRLIVQEWAPEGEPLFRDATAEYARLHASFEADAWLAGTDTMEEFAQGKPQAVGAASAPPPRPWHRADPHATHFAIAIDRKGRLHWSSPVADEGHVVVVLGASVPDAHLAELAAGGVSYLVMPDDDIDLGAMLSTLGERLGIRRLLLEGGATINGAFLKAGLVDEVSLLLCPAIGGKSGSPAIFEMGADAAQPQALELLSATPGAHGTCHLRYRVRTGHAAASATGTP